MGNITQLDHALGMVMDALDEQDLSENTFFFFTSDNGPEGASGPPTSAKGGSTGGLRGRKRGDHEGGIRVARWPGHIKPGTTSDIPVIGTDLFSTILDITGLEQPKDRTIDGVSILPAFAGKPLTRPVPLFWRTHVSPPDDRVAMRIGDWKIIGNETLTNFMLFNIQKDWQEKNNLAAEMPEKSAEMKATLLKVWKEIEAEGPPNLCASARDLPSTKSPKNSAALREPPSLHRQTWITQQIQLTHSLVISRRLPGILRQSRL